jgi:serine phosphatase RsbU (regulator of sigma subunit)
LRVVIGDVCGHGPDEAALGATLRSAWRALVLADFPTPDVLATVDRLLRTERENPNAFVTLCMVDVEPDHRTAWITLAGHPAPVLLDDAVRPVADDERGPLMGVLDGVDWTAARVELPPRWGFLLYTDGLVEGRAHASSDERLGEDRALAIVRRHWAVVDGMALVDAVVTEVEEAHGGPLTDDVAVCLVEGRWR